MRLSIVLALLLTGCASVRLPAAEQANLDPVSFFEGRSHGVGALHVLFSGKRPVMVESLGIRRNDGLLLSQIIREGEKPPRTREWRMQRMGPGRYTGTLTDAEGVVTLTARGPRALVTYRMKNGMEVRQQLALQADERTILNRLEVRKWGVRVAQLDETIRKTD